MLVAATVAAYSNTFGVPYLLDDRFALLDNLSLAAPWDWGAVLNPRAGPTAGRPLLNLTFALNHGWNGNAVAGYHAVNLLVHLCGGLTLFGLVRRTLQLPCVAARFAGVSVPLSFAVAGFWMLHPVQTAAVTYLSQRAESLMALFYLLVLYGFVRAATASRSAGWLTCSALACLGGMATKEVMVTAPAVVLLFDRAFVADSFRAAVLRRWKYYAGLAATWALLGYLMLSSRLHERGVGFSAGESAWIYAVTEVKAVVLYARLSIWPEPLVFDYGPEFLVRDISSVLPHAAVLAFLGAGALALWRRSAAVGFPALAFFLVLAPTSSVVPVASQPAAESRMYLPLAAAAALVVLTVHTLAGRRAWPCLAALVLGCGVLTFARNTHYHSVTAIWQDSLAKREVNSRGHNNLAVELQRLPTKTPEAIRHFERALEIDPGHVSAHHALAVLLSEVPGRESDAKAHYEAALRLQPRYVEAHNNLGALLAREPHHRSEAIAHFEEAVRLNPDFAEAHNNLGQTLAPDPARTADALAHLEKAVRLKPGYAAAHFNLANLLTASPDRLDEAIAHYRTALQFAPDLAMAHYNLANLLARTPARLPEAIAHYEQAAQLAPRDPSVRNNLAVAYANAGRTDDAIREMQAALELAPTREDLRANLRNLQGK